jgi:hypothetical protein
VSGHGIAEFRVVERITFGLLSKPLAFRMHSILTVPFLVLLGLHIYFSYRRRSIPKELKLCAAGGIRMLIGPPFLALARSHVDSRFLHVKGGW